jgi:adenosylmethionine-8-amino-7-oxononanoate aminotransferase
MIVDEVITGWGRMGTWTACELYDVVPDMLTLGKALSALYLPLSATVVKDEIAEVFTGESVLQHVYTMAGTPSCCACGLAVIEYMEKENILEQVKRKAAFGKDENEKIEREFKCVGTTYSTGLEFGMQLVKDKEKREKFSNPEELQKVISEVGYANGVIIYAAHGTVVNAPSLTVTDEELLKIFNTTKRGLEEIERSLL